MLDEPMPINGTNLSISGSGMTGAYEGQGHSDGRRRRAECVEVMREKGMKMIEASKSMKEHGLYLVYIPAFLKCNEYI
jgi:hypothetical protein